MKLRYVDLFSGMGGFRQALAAPVGCGVHYLPVASCDFDPWCARFYAEAFGTNEIFIPNVKDIAVDVTSHGPGGTLKLPSFDLLLGGFPCQPFANIGQGGGLSDPRGALFFDVVNILRTYRPAFFVLENVQKLRNLGKGSALQLILQALGDAGYNVSLWDLCASDYGVPQRRRRFFFCGSRDDLFSRETVPAPPAMPASARMYPTTWHLLERQMPEAHVVPPKTRETVLRKNPKWEGDLDINLAVARPLTASMSKWHRANQDNYFSAGYVFAKSSPVGRSGGSAGIDEPIRRITPLEGLRLQGFPDRFEAIMRNLGMKSTPAYRLIGNAVPVPLAARVVSHFIDSSLNGRSNSHTGQEHRLELFD